MVHFVVFLFFLPPEGIKKIWHFFRLIPLPPPKNVFSYGHAEDDLV